MSDQNIHIAAFNDIELLSLIKELNPSFSLMDIYQNELKKKKLRDTISAEMMQLPLYDLHKELIDVIKIYGYKLRFREMKLFIEGASGDKNVITNILNDYKIPYMTDWRLEFSAPKGILITDMKIVDEIAKLYSLYCEYIKYI